MYRFFRFFAIALISFLILVPAASAQRHGGFGFRGGWGGWGGGYFGPGWGWYAPYGYWGYPYAYTYMGYSYAYGSAGRPGDVKIVDEPKDDSVYVDGGYAGNVNQLKKFQLRSGSHDIELRDHAGRTVYTQRIEVIPGKTVEIKANQGGR